MDVFGDTDPRLMPSHLFWNCIRLDYSTATRADISKQNYSVCPRHWYIDATFLCSRCNKEFCFTVAEQNQWYEGQRFWIDSVARQCTNCRRHIRCEKSLRREYDRDILDTLESDDFVQKQRMIDVIDELSSFVTYLPTAIFESRKRLARQIGRENDEHFA
jgi:hypothetical protein